MPRLLQGRQRHQSVCARAAVPLCTHHAAAGPSCQDAPTGHPGQQGTCCATNGTRRICHRALRGPRGGLADTRQIWKRPRHPMPSQALCRTRLAHQSLCCPRPRRTQCQGQNQRSACIQRHYFLRLPLHLSFRRLVAAAPECRLYTLGARYRLQAKSRTARRVRHIPQLPPPTRCEALVRRQSLSNFRAVRRRFWSNGLRSVSKPSCRGDTSRRCECATRHGRHSNPKGESLPARAPC